MSTMTISFAPIFFASVTPISPTPPAPMITSASSFSVGTFFSALNAVTPEQASGAACSGLRSPMSNRWRASGTSMCVA